MKNILIHINYTIQKYLLFATVSSKVTFQERKKKVMNSKIFKCESIKKNFFNCLKLCKASVNIDVFSQLKAFSL